MWRGGAAGAVSWCANLDGLSGDTKLNLQTGEAPFASFCGPTKKQEKMSKNADLFAALAGKWSLGRDKRCVRERGLAAGGHALV